MNTVTRIMAAMAIAAGLLCCGAAWADTMSVVDGQLAGPSDWLADVRFRNFNSTISDYEMAVNASPTRTPGQNQVNGEVPGTSYYADWAQNNEFWITYDPLANAGAGLVSLRLKGTGTRQLGTPGGYDITIGRAPDAVTAGPVNYINFQLWDRGNFPTFPNGLTISDLDGQNLGSFTFPTAGIGSWSILDPGGLNLNNGFVLNGKFDLDLALLAEGREGDKITFAIGYNANVPAAAVPAPQALVMLLGLGATALGLKNWRRRGRK